MVIVYKVGLTDEQKAAVRDAVNDLDDDEFIILHRDNQAIYGVKRAERIVISEVIKYF